MATKGGRPENLIPIQDRAKDEQREIRRKGAKGHAAEALDT